MKETNYPNLKAVVMIGKEGLTEGVIGLIKKQLKQKKVIKIKFLKSALTQDKKSLFKQIAEKADARIIHSIGFVVVVGRKL